MVDTNEFRSSPEDLARHEAALLTLDIVGFTRLQQEDPGRAQELLAEHRAVAKERIDKHGGHVAQVAGDTSLAKFNDPVAAAKCALELQVKCAARNVTAPPDRQIVVRMGLHWASVVPVGQDMAGEGVAVAAAVASKAPPGGLCLTHALYEKVKGHLPINPEDLGDQEMDDLPGWIHIYLFPNAGPLPFGPQPLLTEIKVAQPPAATPSAVQAGESWQADAPQAPPRRSAVPYVVVTVCIAVVAAIAMFRPWSSTSRLASAPPPPIAASPEAAAKSGATLPAAEKLVATPEESPELPSARAKAEKPAPATTETPKPEAAAPKAEKPVPAPPVPPPAPAKVEKLSPPTKPTSKPSAAVPATAKPAPATKKTADSSSAPAKAEKATPLTKAPSAAPARLPTRAKDLHARLRKALEKVEKLPPKHQQRLLPDLDDWKKLERRLAGGAGNMDLDRLEQQIKDLERAIASG